MQGIIFNHFTQMVDEKWGEDVTEKMIETSRVPSGAIYTAARNYCGEELVSLVHRLSEINAMPVNDILKTFGTYLFQKIAHKYAAYLEECSDTFDLLKTIEGTIHAEIQKIYPDAKLPTFTYVEVSEKTLAIIYRSPRPFADLAEGVIQGVLDHFDAECELERQDIPVETGAKAVFSITRKG